MSSALRNQPEVERAARLALCLIRLIHKLCYAVAPKLGFALAVLLFLSHGGGSLAATLPDGFAETQIASGLSNPTAMAFAPDGRLFVCLQGGQLRVIKNGALLATPFLTVSVDSTGERGLLGVAFDPNFATNQFVYVYYTVSSTPRHNRVSRFTANGDVAVAGSETLILQLDNLSTATNHNGGAIHFGPDGKLYVAVGENAMASNSQTLANRLGKVLRINSDGTIPADNPFFNTATGANRSIWALGLRNPFTFAFQPGTGRMFINDVGQSSFEEINEGMAGANYGWPACEGVCNPSNPNFRDPVFAYGRTPQATGGCAITGGAFYNPAVAQFPGEYLGKYFFTDLCSGWIRVLDTATFTASGFATGISQPVDLKVGPEGSLYYLARGVGSIFRISYTASLAPSITTHPASQTIPIGQSVTFTVAASGAEPLSYQWQRNDTNISGANSSSYSIPSVTDADNGARFRVVVSNSAGSATSNEATLTVTPNMAPTGTITAPAAGALYRAGETINYAGQATDTEDGTLPASAFTWQVDFHHDNHTHPFIPATTGATGGSFTIPTTGETSANVWYRIHLTVRDSRGLTHSSFRDLLPRKSTLSFATNPAGLQITLDGQPQTTPFAVESVVGMRRTLGVITPQPANGVTYDFASWSDGGAASHEIATPDASTTYTATFSARQIITTIQLSSAAYQTNEGTGGIEITVTRAGDTSAAVSVDYATNDGTASERSDYITALGTLTFAAGQASRSFNVLLVDDLLPEGTETFSVALTNPTSGASLGDLNVATITINDNDAAPSSANPIAAARFFVRQHYLDFLNREPDEAGLNFWTNQITECDSRPAPEQESCRARRREHVSAAFFLSIEFQETGFLVYRLYRAGFGRIPRFREFMRDTQEIGRGVVVGVGDWQQQLREKQQAYLENFVTRAEFTSRLPSNFTPEQYVDTLSGGVLTTAERDALVDGLRRGTLTRASVLQSVVTSGNFTRAETNPAFVLMEYFGYLRRNPNDPPDSDFGGYDFWLNKLVQANGDYIASEMVKSFILSIEYRARFGAP